MEKANRVVQVGLAVLVLGGALGLGLGIKKIRSLRSEGGTEVKDRAEARDTRGQEAVVVEEAAVEVNTASVVVQEEAEAEQVVAAEETAASEQNEVEANTPVERPMMTGGGMPGWRTIWADLNLTEAERARLREGFQLAMQKWQNMSEDERATETARMQSMRLQWESMSDDEREQASGRMRDRFEEWRQSGRVELPQLSLD